jgi:murein DD-endopeptidase MepM/ murein hydrolase activator NlpD
LKLLLNLTRSLMMQLVPALVLRIRVLSMRTRFQSCTSKKLLKILAATALAGTAAACSSDSSRFGENPFTNPFSAAAPSRVDASPTGSIPNRLAPVGSVTSQPLPPTLARSSLSNTNLQNAVNPLNPKQFSSAPSSIAQPLPRVASSTLQQASQQASPIAGSAAGWTASGGTPVTVGAGETAAVLSARYGVPTAAITAANGGQVVPGQQAIIPIYSGNGAAPKAGVANPVRQPSFAPPKPVASAAQPVTKQLSPTKSADPSSDSDDEDGKPGKVAVAAPVKPVSPLKSANPSQDDDEEDEPSKKAGTSKKIVAAAPAAKGPIVAASTAKSSVKPLAPQKQPEADDDDEEEAPAKKPAKQTATLAEKPQAVAKAQPRVIPLTPQAAKPAEPDLKVAEAPKVDATTTQSIPPATPVAAKGEDKPEFRWPAKGRVISGFGSKGGNGDGIAIAVPEGTPVKAAEGGTVAYAGEELKGYGKLVLVRHDNGFVSAYAHNGELNVKRGEKVSRGQMIAKSGSTGNVTSPQLHFELRKGSTPVDPTKFLEN